MPMSERQHGSNKLLVGQSWQFMANKMLKYHDIVYQNHIRTLRFKEDAEEILVLNDTSGDKFFHYSFHSKIV